MANDMLVLKPKKLRGDDGFKVFSIRVRDEIVSALDDLSSKSGHSRNELIGTLLEFAIKHCVVQD